MAGHGDIMRATEAQGVSYSTSASAASTAET